MTFEETMKLVEAGYKADEIRALAAEEANEAPNEPEAPKDPEAPKEGGEPAPVTPEMKELTETVKTLTDTVKKMQEENIKNARIGSVDVHADPIKEKMDEFLQGL